MPLMQMLSTALAEATGTDASSAKKVSLPLSDPNQLRSEMADAGFTVQIEHVTHAIERGTIAEFWQRAQHGFAPIALMRHHMGEAAFLPIAEKVGEILKDRFTGPVHHEMTAYLALGSK